MSRLKSTVLLIALTVAPVLSVPGCGKNQSASGGCSVNGVYYPNGNAGNGQCTCPPIGSCTITFPALVRFRSPDRSGFTVTLLSPRAVLVTGGRDANGRVMNSAILEDLTAGAGQSISLNMSEGGTAHTATLLGDGKVLLAGGRDDSGSPLNTAELFDPTNRSFTKIASHMAWDRAEHSATLLDDGKVMLVGGSDNMGPLDYEEIYDPQTQRFQSLPY